MSRKSKQKTGSKVGYGTPNVNKRKVTKKDISKILSKDWNDVSSYELYTLFQMGHKTEDIRKVYNISLVKILNRLRFNETV
jgi:hypothetical protein